MKKFASIWQATILVIGLTTGPVYSQQVLSQESNISVELLHASQNASQNASDHDVKPSSVVTLVGRISNHATRAETVVPQLDLPSGWHMLTALESIDIPGLDNKILLLPIRIPDNAKAGSYNVGLSANTGSKILPASFDFMLVHIARIKKITMRASHATEYAVAGQDVESRLTVTNDGNAREKIVLRGRTNDGARVDIDPNVVILESGQSVQVDTRAPTNSKITSVTPLSLHFTALHSDENSTVASLSLMVRIIPSPKRASPIRRVIPASVFIRTVGDEQTYNPEVGLSGSIPALGGNLAVDLVLARSNRVSMFGTRDRYSVSFTSKKGTLYAGDHIQTISPLTTRGQFGSGFGGEWRISRFRLRTTVQRSRHLIPQRSIVGGSLAYMLPGNTTIGLNYARHDGLYRGAITTLRAEGSPVADRVNYDVECGFDSKSNFERPSCFAELYGFWDKFSYRSGLLRTTTSYPGYASGINEQSLAVTYRPFHGFQLNGTGRYQARSLDPGYGRRNLYLRIGAGYGTKMGNLATFSDVHFIRQELSYKSTDFIADRTEDVVRLTSTVQARKIGVHATLDLGNAKSTAGGYGGNIFRARMMVRSSPSKRFTFSATAEHATGYLVDSPSEMSRWLFSVHSSFNIGNRTKLLSTIHRNVTSSVNRFAYRSIQFSLAHSFPSGHEIRFQVQHNRFDDTTEGGNLDYRLSYSLPLDIPFLGGKRTLQTVEGRVYDANTGQGISGALVFLDGEAGLTDAEGRFRVKSPAGGKAYLRIDQRSIGLDVTPVYEMPFLVEPQNGSYPFIDIPIVKTGSVIGTLILKEDPYRIDLVRTSRFAENEKTRARDIVLELSSSTRTYRDRTDRYGRFHFSTIPEGIYDLQVLSATIPSGYLAPDEKFQLEVEAGKQNLTEILLYPIERRLQMLKESNVIAADGDADKIPDISLAKSAETVDLTESDPTVGSASYMSPEQAHGGGENSGHMSEQAVADSVLNVDPPLLDSSVPENVEAITHELIEKIPAEQPEGAGGVQQRLKEVQQPHNSAFSSERSIRGLVQIVLRKAAFKLFAYSWIIWGILIIAIAMISLVVLHGSQSNRAYNHSKNAELRSYGH